MVDKIKAFKSQLIRSEAKIQSKMDALNGNISGWFKGFRKILAQRAVASELKALEKSFHKLQQEHQDLARVVESVDEALPSNLSAFFARMGGKLKRASEALNIAVLEVSLKTLNAAHQKLELPLAPDEQFGKRIQLLSEPAGSVIIDPKEVIRRKRVRAIATKIWNTKEQLLEAKLAVWQSKQKNQQVASDISKVLRNAYKGAKEGATEVLLTLRGTSSLPDMFDLFLSDFSLKLHVGKNTKLPPTLMQRQEALPELVTITRS